MYVDEINKLTSLTWSIESVGNVELSLILCLYVLGSVDDGQEGAHEVHDDRDEVEVNRYVEHLEALHHQVQDLVAAWPVFPLNDASVSHRCLLFAKQVLFLVRLVNDVVVVKIDAELRTSTASKVWGSLLVRFFGKDTIISR